ncbi:PepSY-associated TM helix domain-containing protein [Paludibacterium yongneupense]|uniref:PepSY-associated TM helix domain-containing protein n=1 Tax=Paludibacterium yongneupense TaxID=400061 RepID=UPI0006847435|nr:PepSY-associated TM helix domain-containing protein [Paludibacterium yongneupense]
MMLVHRYLGLTAALAALVLGLSGSLLLGPGLAASPAARPATADFDALRASLQRRYPGAGFDLYPARQAHGTLPARVRLRDGTQRLRMDMRTAGIVDADTGAEDRWELLRRLHTAFALGAAGRSATGVAGFALLLLALSGLACWWPRDWRRAWRPRRGNARLRTADWHRWAGAWLSPLLLVSALTGSTLAFPALFATAPRSSAARAPQPSPAHPDGSAAPSLNRLAALAAAAMPGGTISALRVGADPRQPIRIRVRLPGDVHPNGNSVIDIDPASGAIIRSMPYYRLGQAARVKAWFYAVHTGSTGGRPWRALMFATGLGLAALGASGVWQWAARPRRRKAHADAGECGKR